MDEEKLWDLADKAEKMLDEATKVNALRFKLTDEEPDIFSSKIGGTPYIPRGMNAPADIKGRQMKILAQIDCSLLSELPDYPHEGMLQFWLSEYEPWSDWKIVYHKTIDKTVKASEIPYTPIFATWNDERQFPVIGGGYGMETKLVQDSLSLSDERYGRLFCHYLAQLTGADFLRGYDGDIGDLHDPSGGGSGHKFGGYHYDPQTWHTYRYDPDFVSDIGSDDEQLLLFQLEYDHGFGKEWYANAKVIIGDCGVLHFFIKRKDLKALDFDKAIYDQSSS